MGFLRATLLAILVIEVGRTHAQYPPRQSHYSGGHGYHANFFSSTCSAENQCYDYTIILTVDGAFSFAGDAAQFKKHHEMAGFDRARMIREGRRAARFLKAKYGVDATNLPDDTYLAPLVKLSRGITFNFVTVNPTLYMAANRNQVQFYNLPTSVGWWNIDFSEDYTSTGTFNGKIPAGARVYRGSFVVDACPHASPYHTQCLVSNSPGGRVFLRFHTNDYVTGYKPGLFFKINSVLEQAEWGIGCSRGVFFVNQATGVTTGHEVLTFPDTCTSRGRCYSGGRHRTYK